ncbi:MAG: hypothetical protein JWO05_1010 [Gemmatimonadetes bacterium]|nr:hypothetical protein [Gemmatimonadota bacterium]
MLGILRPLASSPLGLGLVGFVTALPIIAGLLFLSPFGAPIQIDVVSVWAVIGLSAVFGPATAAYVTIRNRQRNSFHGDA